MTLQDLPWKTDRLTAEQKETSPTFSSSLYLPHGHSFHFLSRFLPSTHLLPTAAEIKTLGPISSTCSFHPEVNVTHLETISDRSQVQIKAQVSKTVEAIQAISSHLHHLVHSFLGEITSCKFCRFWCVPLKNIILFKMHQTDTFQSKVSFETIPAVSTRRAASHPPSEGKWKRFSELILHFFWIVQATGLHSICFYFA